MTFLENYDGILFEPAYWLFCVGFLAGLVAESIESRWVRLPVVFAATVLGWWLMGVWGLWT